MEVKYYYRYFEAVIGFTHTIGEEIIQRYKHQEGGQARVCATQNGRQSQGEYSWRAPQMLQM